MPLFSPRASRASCQKHLTTWASLNSLQITAGTELAAAGIDLLVLRELMGHASPESTAAYVHLSSDTLAAEFAKARAVIR